MSLDYPNRQDWLAVREFSLPRVRQVRVSGTFDAGRNQAKRIAREQWSRNRTAVVARHAEKKRPGRAPKWAHSSLTMIVLSDRRLRQRTGKL